MTDYWHEYIAMATDEGGYRCSLCGKEIFEPTNDFCPERIVQEVVARLKAELQSVNVLPGKRKDRDRPRRLN